LITEQLPIGLWPEDQNSKLIGWFQQEQLFGAVDSYTPALLSRPLDWSRLEIEVLCAKVKGDLANPSIHLYQNVYIVYGRKP
jgi:hypothetical protein